ncbi:MAG: BadF/BadG/BcrA/BcrD ATPase family protein [Nibricoccus sp.]
MAKNPAQLFRIGVDGGGSKTELILIDHSGTVVARHHAPGCNPSHVGPVGARETLISALQALIASSKTKKAELEISHMLLCMAGSPDFWREAAASLTDYGQVETTTDAAPVLELATEGRPGLVLHAGTGSFVALRTTDGAMRYIGGLGWRLGDPGSSLDIGRRATARALAELQGWAEKTALSEALVELFSTDKPSAITASLHRSTEPNQIIGSFAACVSQLAAKGDATALAIILGSTGELLACAEAAARSLVSTQELNTLPAGLSGSILTQPFVVAELQKRSALPLKPLTERPIEGVRRLLCGKP